MIKRISYFIMKEWFLLVMVIVIAMIITLFQIF